MELVVRVPLRDGGVREARLIEGPAGWGECSPLPGYPCSPEAARAAADEAAFEGWPAPVRDSVEVNALLAEPSAEAAVAAVAEGYRVLKLKVSANLDVVAAVRDAVGPTVELRVDPNGAWSVDEALVNIGRLDRLGVAMVEQPVRYLHDLARVRRGLGGDCGVAIAADECVRSIEHAVDVRRFGAADAIVLKVQPLGGVRAAMEIAEAADLPAVVTSMMETSVGLAAGLALAAALPELDWACGLGTATFLAADVVADPLVPVGGRLPVRRPVPDPVLLDRYRVSAA